MRSYGTEQNVLQVNLIKKCLDYITPQNWKRKKYTFHYKNKAYVKAHKNRWIIFIIFKLIFRFFFL